jgi:hypothetical protein
LKAEDYTKAQVIDQVNFVFVNLYLFWKENFLLPDIGSLNKAEKAFIDDLENNTKTEIANHETKSRKRKANHENKSRIRKAPPSSTGKLP